MDKLIVVCHGDYFSDHHLKPAGIEAMEYLASDLMEFVSGRSMAMLSSQHFSAKESMHVLRSYFVDAKQKVSGIEVFVHSSADNLEEPVEAVTKALTGPGEILIICAHLDVFDFIKYFTKIMLGTELCKIVREGEACVIDMAKGISRDAVLTLIRPHWPYPPGERI